MGKQQRRLYKIGHITKLLGITSRTVRYYDQMGILPHVKRSEGNVRLFDDEDVTIIKQIRRLQQEEHLSLDAIKLRLFGQKNDAQKHTALITDSSASLSTTVSQRSHLEILPVSIKIDGKTYVDRKDITTADIYKLSQSESPEITLLGPSEAAYTQALEKLEKRGFKKVVIITMGAQFSSAHQNAVSAANKFGKLEIEVHNSHSIGSGLGLLVELLSDALEAHDSDREFQLLLTKQIPLIYQLIPIFYGKGFLSNNSGTSLPQNPEKGAQFDLINQFLSFIPLVRNRGENPYLEVVDIIKNRQSAQDFLLFLLEEEIKYRGNYSRKILISYNYAYGEGLDLINKLKSEYPSTPLELVEGSVALSAVFGPDVLCVGII